MCSRLRNVTISLNGLFPLHPRVLHFCGGWERKIYFHSELSSSAAFRADIKALGLNKAAEAESVYPRPLPQGGVASEPAGHCKNIKIVLKHSRGAREEGALPPR